MPVKLDKSEVNNGHQTGSGEYKSKYEIRTYCNFLSDSKDGISVPSTKSTSA